MEILADLASPSLQWRDLRTGISHQQTSGCYGLASVGITHLTESGWAFKKGWVLWVSVLGGGDDKWHPQWDHSASVFAEKWLEWHCPHISQCSQCFQCLIQCISLKVGSRKTSVFPKKWVCFLLWDEELAAYWIPSLPQLPGYVMLVLGSVPVAVSTIMVGLLGFLSTIVLPSF